MQEKAELPTDHAFYKQSSVPKCFSSQCNREAEASMFQNETERQLQMTNLDRRMRDAYSNSHRVISKKQAAQMKLVSVLLAVALGALVGVLLFLLGDF